MVLIALSGSTLIINFNLTSALSGCRRVAWGAFCQCVQFYRFALYYNYFEEWPSCYHGRGCRHVSIGLVWHGYLVGVASTLVDVSLWGLCNGCVYGITLILKLISQWIYV